MDFINKTKCYVKGYELIFINSINKYKSVNLKRENYFGRTFHISFIEKNKWKCPLTIFPNKIQSLNKYNNSCFYIIIPYSM